MELRRAADLLLRSQTTPLSCLLNPSAASRWQAGAQLCYRSINNRATQRTFISSSRNNALKPHPTTSASPPKPSEEPIKENTPSDTIEELSKSLWASPRSNGPSRFPSSPSPRLDPEREKRMNGGDTAADLLAAMNAAMPPSRSSGLNTSLMMDPIFPLSANNGDNPQSLMSDLGAGPLATPKTTKIQMRLTPSTGRSVSVGTGIDVGRAMRLLEQSCARNKVRADFTRQRFHERGGLKRKRLGRERWRKRFMEGFRATVGRVKQLKNQGW